MRLRSTISAIVAAALSIVFLQIGWQAWIGLFAHVFITFHLGHSMGERDLRWRIKRRIEQHLTVNEIRAIREAEAQAGTEED